MFSNFIKLNKLDDINRILQGEPIPTTINLTTLKKASSLEDHYVIKATIMAIKKQKRNVSIRNTRTSHEKQGEYHTLVTLLEQTSNTIFYILNKTLTESQFCFAWPKRNWLGEFVTIYEPLATSKQVHGIDLLDITQPMIPTKNTREDSTIPINMNHLPTNDIVPFNLYIEAGEINIKMIEIIQGCGGIECDSSHKSAENCISLSKATPKNVLKSIIEIKSMNITCEFRSRRFLELFVDTSTIGEGAEASTETFNIRRHIRTMMVQGATDQRIFNVMGIVHQKREPSDINYTSSKTKIITIKPIGWNVVKYSKMEDQV